MDVLTNVEGLRLEAWAAANGISFDASEESAVLSVSTPVKGILGLPDVCLSLPAVVARGGVQTVLPLELDKERERYRAPAPG